MHFATPKGQRGFIHAGHFGYGHIDPVVSTGETVVPGPAHRLDMRGRLARAPQRVRLHDRAEASPSNPLRPGGKLDPYVDTAPPDIHEVRFYTVANPEWERRPTTSVALLPQAGQRMRRPALSGRVDVRVRVNDPQSFIGWFADHPELAAPHHPFRLAVSVVDVARDRIVQASRGVSRGAGPRSAGRATLRAGNRAEPSGEGLHQAPSRDPLRRHLLVPAVPERMGHDAARRRPVRGPRPSMGRRRQPLPLDRPGDDRERRLDQTSGTSPSQRTAPGSCRSR